jgi:hypothetical protein
MRRRRDYVAVNSNVALVLAADAGGFVVIVVSGGVVSIVQLKLAGVGSLFPAASIACTWNV